MNKYMSIAYKEASKAFSEDEVPVGAVIVYKDKVIAKAHNKKMQKKDVFAHAEVLAIKKAIKTMGDWRLNECVMYVTLEPCPMCASAIQQSRINKIYIGTKAPFVSLEEIDKNIMQNSEFNHYVDVEYLNIPECSNILSDFFKMKRIKK